MYGRKLSRHLHYLFANSDLKPVALSVVEFNHETLGHRTNVRRWLNLERFIQGRNFIAHNQRIPQMIMTKMGMMLGNMTRNKLADG